MGMGLSESTAITFDWKAEILICSFLRSKSLRTNILKIVQTGTHVFDRVEVGMRKIALWSSRVSSPRDGLVSIQLTAYLSPLQTLMPIKIDTILKCAPTKSIQASAKEIFEIHVEDLRKTSDDCIKEAQELECEMTGWRDLILEVLYAVSDKQCTCFVLNSSRTIAY